MAKDTESGAVERTIYSVSALTGLIKNSLEKSFPLISVEGEISNCRNAPSGHSYFTIKDAGAVIAAVLFKGSRRFCEAELADGTKAIFTGNISVYPQRGNYQLIIRSVQQSGVGDLHQRFEQLKKKLFEEGLFRPEHKKPIPFHPKRVGIITSPGAAALQDILRVSRKRFPGIDIIIYPTQVQGASAAGEIIRALQQADMDAMVDVLIISRGGGSLEDLWPFNEERVGRAIHACRIPTVSGVGHEIDYTISDFIADLRAATPSAAAEAVFPERTARLADVRSTCEHNRHLLLQRIRDAAALIRERSGPNLHRRLQRLVEQAAMMLDEHRERIRTSTELTISRARTRAGTLLGRISVLDPRAPLRKGFALIRDNQGSILRNPAGLAEGEAIHIQFGKGSADAVITAKHPEQDSGPPGRQH